MIPKKVIYQIHQQPIEIFSFPDQPFAEKFALTIGYLYQLLPVNTKLVYARTFDFTQPISFISTYFWRLFQLVELTQVIDQKNKTFIEMIHLHCNWVMKVLKKCSKSRPANISNSDHPKYGSHLFVENAPMS